MKIFISNNNRFFILLFMFTYTTCCKQHKSFAKNKSTILLNEIHNIVDSMDYNPILHNNDFIYTITHQRKEGKDYIKISPAEYFNKDSVSTYKMYKEHLLIFYSKKFFKKELDNVDTTGLKKYIGLAYNDETISMYHPQYKVIEILSDATFRPLSLEECQEKKLFNYNDIYIPEPEPNDFK